MAQRRGKPPVGSAGRRLGRSRATRLGIGAEEPRRLVGSNLKRLSKIPTIVAASAENGSGRPFVRPVRALVGSRLLRPPAPRPTIGRLALRGEAPAPPPTIGRLLAKPPMTGRLPTAPRGELPAPPLPATGRPLVKPPTTGRLPRALRGELPAPPLPTTGRPFVKPPTTGRLPRALGGMR